MITIGNTHRLSVIRLVDFGAYLDAGNIGEVLLPRKYLPRDLSVGATVEVFLYLDSADRPVATTQQPKARVGEFACLKVVDTTAVGAFLDWGLDKDVLAPFAQQHRPMEVGRSYLVYLYLDRVDGRITASSKIDHFLEDKAPHTFAPRQLVNLIIAQTTELGFKAIINHSHWGLLYKNEVHQRLSFGQHVNGYIKGIRPDGKIDLSLQDGPQAREQNEDLIMHYLEQQHGFASLHDKSPPELIAKLFGISKSAFKKALGGLYKKRLIVIHKNGIRLTRDKGGGGSGNPW